MMSDDPVHRDLLPLYKAEPNRLSDEELLKFYSDSKRPDKSAKLQALPFSLSARIDLSMNSNSLCSKGHLDVYLGQKEKRLGGV